jgi:hypothetical protein
MSQAINCSSCGAANKLPEGKDSMFCDFCGNSIIKIKQANEHTDPAADPKIKNYLELAQNAMDSSDFDEAIRYFNKVLENNPKISEAWFGKGYCSGWSGNLNSIRVDQMILNYNKAIEYCTEDKLQDLKIKISESIYGCAFSIYKLSYDHTIEFAQVDGTYKEHLSRSTDILAALEVAYSFNSQSKAVIESLLSISKNLLEPIKFKNYDDRWESLSLDQSSSKKIKEIYDKYFHVMEGVDPEYVSKIKKQEDRIKKLKLTGLTIVVIFLLFVFWKSGSKSYDHSDGNLNHPSNELSDQNYRDNSTDYTQDLYSENNLVEAPTPAIADNDLNHPSNELSDQNYRYKNLSNEDVESSIKDNVRNQLESYYNSLSSNSYDDVITFYTPIVSKYLALKNVSKIKIIESHRDHVAKNQIYKQKCVIDASSLIVKYIDNENYRSTFNMDYFIYKTDKYTGNSVKQYYNLDIEILLNNSFKIYSMSQKIISKDLNYMEDYPATK